MQLVYYFAVLIFSIKERYAVNLLKLNGRGEKTVKIDGVLNLAKYQQIPS